MGIVLHARFGTDRARRQVQKPPKVQNFVKIAVFVGFSSHKMNLSSPLLVSHHLPSPPIFLSSLSFHFPPSLPFPSLPFHPLPVSLSSAPVSSPLITFLFPSLSLFFFRCPLPSYTFLSLCPLQYFPQNLKFVTNYYPVSSAATESHCLRFLVNNLKLVGGRFLTTLYATSPRSDGRRLYE